MIEIKQKPWFVTVVNPLQQALVVRTSEEEDSAVAHAHKEKLRKHEARCSAEAIIFLPLAVDTWLVPNCNAELSHAKVSVGFS